MLLIAAQLAADVPYCPDVYGVATHPHPEYCDKFYLCENGTLTLETCENGLLYDGKGAVHNHCNYNWAVNCDKRLNESKSWDLSQTSITHLLFLFFIALSCLQKGIVVTHAVKHNNMAFYM